MSTGGKAKMIKKKCAFFFPSVPAVYISVHDILPADFIFLECPTSDYFVSFCWQPRSLVRGAPEVDTCLVALS